MANKMETLSDKIFEENCDGGCVLFYRNGEKIVTETEEYIETKDVREFIKEERKILDSWVANLKRDEIGGRELGIEDLLRLSKRLNELAGDALVSGGDE